MNKFANKLLTVLTVNNWGLFWTKHGQNLLKLLIRASLTIIWAKVCRSKISIDLKKPSDSRTISLEESKNCKMSHVITRQLRNTSKNFFGCSVFLSSLLKLIPLLQPNCPKLFLNQLKWSHFTLLLLAFLLSYPKAQKTLECKINRIPKQNSKFA